MASNYKLYLKDTSAKDKTLIYVSISVRNKRYKFSTGESISPVLWNAAKQEARKSNFSAEMNERLRTKGNALIESVRSLISEGVEINRERIEERMKSILFPGADKTGKQNPKIPTFVEFVKQMIDEARSGIRTYKGRKYSPFTVVAHNSCLVKLKEYEKLRGVTLTFNDLNRNFYNDYISFYNDQNKALNSLGGQIKDIKAFANAAIDRGYHVNPEIRYFKKLAEQTEQVYLSTDELESIWNLDLSENKKLDHARDVFLIGCYTGLRFSDLKSLKPSDIVGNRLRLKTQKTEEDVVIPLHPIVKSILEKHNYIPPTSRVNRELNLNIREICKLAEINSQVSSSKTLGGKLEKKMHFKYEMVTVHTARRSFATNTYLAGLDPLSIMKLTGHKTEKAFFTYIRVTLEQNADKVAEHPFFN